MSFSKHPIGWLVLASQESHKSILAKISAGLTAYGLDCAAEKTVISCGNVGLGLVHATEPSPLSTWSLYVDAKLLCLVEGVFYGNYGSYSPVPGKDPQLAFLVLSQFQKTGAKSFAGLNGAFCVVILNGKSSVLSTVWARR